MRVGCLFYVSLSGKLGEKLENRENPPTGSCREASGLGEKLENRENPPTGSCREASGLGEKLENRENPPN